MPVVAAFASPKHAPGATTTCLATSLAWSRGERGGPTVVVEADPAGGDLAARLFRDPPVVNLATLAPTVRHVVDEGRLAPHLRELQPHLHLLPAPMSAADADASLRAVAQQLSDYFALSEWAVMADLGRLSPESPALPFARRATTLVWTIRPTLEAVRHLRDRLTALARVEPAIVDRSTAAVVDDGDYDAAEVADVLGIPVLGTVEFDRRGVEVLLGRTTWRPTALMRDARALVAALQRRQPAPRPSPAVVP